MTDTPIHHTQVLVIGAGLAGMQVALNLGERRVTLVTSGELGSAGASPRAKGGIAVPVSASDHPRLHAADTMNCGAGLCHDRAVQVATEEGYRRLRGLVDLGVEFDRADTGALALGREAAHSRRRIVRAGGDRTGAAVCATVAAQLRGDERITLVENRRAVALICDDSQGARRVRGAWLVDADGHLEAVLAKATVLATGGLGQLYAYTSNPLEARGEGLLLAQQAGAELVDLEFVQFHPTALATAAKPLPLLSEAIRGEGAILVDDTGERFMIAEHELAELAPRDVVARAIWRRRQRGHEVFLDVRAIDDFARRFPAAFADCRAHGLAPDRERLPVVPVAHYHMGGVAVDLDGRTSVDGLWACGEVAATGLHGANRLASNSLLEAMVFGARAGTSVADALDATARSAAPFSAPPRLARPSARVAGRVDADVLAQVQAIMWHDVGLTRSAAGLERALGELDALAQEHPADQPSGALISLASLIALAALRRQESRGAHYREDFPDARDAWRRRLVFSDDGLITESPCLPRGPSVSG